MDKRIIVLILIVFVALIGGMMYLKKKRDAKAKAKAKARAAAKLEEAKEAEEKATREAKERAKKEAEEESMRKAKEENDRAEAEAASKLKLLRIKQKKAAAAQRRPPRRPSRPPRRPSRPSRRPPRRIGKTRRPRSPRDPSGCGPARSIRASRCRHQYNSNLRAARHQAKQQGRRVCFGNVCANPPDPKTVERQRQQQAAAAERRRQQQEAQRRRQQQEAERKRAANASFDASDANSTQEKSTKPNHWGGGNSIYLDRHNVDCGNKALKGFHLRRPRGNQINYNYQCGGTTSGASINKNSGTNNWGGGHTLYLDRHKVDCGPNPLHQFKLTRPNRSSVRYDYKCGDSRHSGGCRQKNTGWNQGHRMSIYLDRHKIRCDNDEVLKSFKLNRQPRTGWPGKMRYDYECCKI